MLVNSTPLMLHVTINMKANFRRRTRTNSNNYTKTIKKFILDNASPAYYKRELDLIQDISKTSVQSYEKTIERLTKSLEYDAVKKEQSYKKRMANFAYSDDAMKRKNQAVADQFNAHGDIYVEIFERDCDMVESTTFKKFTSIASYFKTYEAYAESAEGALNFHIISPEKYEEYKDERFTRDRVMEAFENGMGTSIYV